MSNSKTALEWLYVQADLQDFVDKAERDPNTMWGDHYRDEMQKRIDKFLAEKVDEKYHERLNKVVKNNVYTNLAGSRKIEENVDSRWEAVREKVRFTPPGRERQAIASAEAETKRAERTAAAIKSRNQKVTYEALLDKIQATTSRDEFNTVYKDILKEKDKTTAEKVLSDYQSNQLLSVYQARKDVYYPLQPKKTTAIQSRIVSENDLKKEQGSVRQYFGSEAFKKTYDDIAVVEPWKASRKEKEVEVKSFLESRQRIDNKESEVTPRDKIYDTFLRQNNKSFVGYNEKKEILAELGTAKNPRIAKVNRLSPAQTEEVRTALKADIAKENQQIASWASNANEDELYEGINSFGGIDILEQGLPKAYRTNYTSQYKQTGIRGTKKQ